MARWAILYSSVTCTSALFRARYTLHALIRLRTTRVIPCGCSKAVLLLLLFGVVVLTLHRRPTVVWSECR